MSSLFRNPFGVIGEKEGAVGDGVGDGVGLNSLGDGGCDGVSMGAEADAECESRYGGATGPDRGGGDGDLS